MKTGSAISMGFAAGSLLMFLAITTVVARGAVKLFMGIESE